MLRKKIHNFSLAILSAMIIFLGFNNFLIHNNNGHNLVRQPTAKFIVYKPKSENKTTHPKKRWSEVKEKIKKSRKQIKRELRKLKKELKKQKNKKGVGALKLLLVLLTLGISIFLSLLIFLLSYNISFSGQEGLAGVILILGWAGVLWLLVIGIKKINNIGQVKD